MRSRQWNLSAISYRKTICVSSIGFILTASRLWKPRVGLARCRRQPTNSAFPVGAAQPAELSRPRGSWVAPCFDRTSARTGPNGRRAGRFCRGCMPLSANSTAGPLMRWLRGGDETVLVISVAPVFASKLGSCPALRAFRGFTRKSFVRLGRFG